MMKNIVICSPKQTLGIFMSTCNVDVRWFPFDIQKCEMKFGSWTFDGWLLDLQMTDADISGYMPNGEWDLVGEWKWNRVIIATYNKFHLELDTEWYSGSKIIKQIGYLNIKFKFTQLLERKVIVMIYLRCLYFIKLLKLNNEWWTFCFTWWCSIFISVCSILDSIYK